ncbi:uncharacterized protein MELLADRAFT_61185 [Melampsora larici-populina 98AG31]|uniref:Uncharacterized protein n=1 Tax=Melampsora larici-populina (strain 98AG31 / pathotype 3-4-7) TaxID=747676 RepID=F4RDX3_MELLP|nr:uncharacterized protein MELLADRAFT_61185 [Melampsora larici-populina 98AG31]EGG09476.1 hypothetical protein MELLADRAFT_61185 [Melampsora larici-populina 98AG31]
MEYDATQSSSSDSLELGPQRRAPGKERLTLADFLRTTAPADFNPGLKNSSQSVNQPRPSRIPLDFQLSKLNATLFANNKTTSRPSLPIKPSSSASVSNHQGHTTNIQLQAPSSQSHPIQKLRHAGTASHPDLASLVRVARKRSKTLITQPDSSLQPPSENPNPSTSTFHYSAHLPSSSNLSSTTIAPRVTPLPKPKQAPSSPIRAILPNNASCHQFNSLNSPDDFNPYSQSPSGPGCRNSAPITTSSHPSVVSLQPVRLARASTGSSRCYSISYSDDPGTDHTSQSTLNSQLASLPTESPYSPPSLSPSLDPPLAFTSGTGGTGLAGLVAAHKERRKAKDSSSSRSINSDTDSIFLKCKSSSGQQSIYDFLRSTHPPKRSTARSTASDTADETDEEGEDTRHIRRTLEPVPPAAFQYFHRLLPTSSAINVDYSQEPSRSVVMDRSASHAALNLNGQWAWGGQNDNHTEPLDQHSLFHTTLNSPVTLTPVDMAKSAKLNLRNRSISKPNPPTSSHPSREEDAQANVSCPIYHTPSCLTSIFMICQLSPRAMNARRHQVGSVFLIGHLYHSNICWRNDGDSYTPVVHCVFS